MATDEYKAKYVKAIKECITDEQIGTVIDKIYEDGLEDGANEGVNGANEGVNTEQHKETPFDYHELD